MNVSFTEKSVWVQMAAVTLGLGVYAAVAGPKMAAGEAAIGAYVPLFIAAVTLVIVVSIVGHIVVAMVAGEESADERDRLFAHRAERCGAWLYRLGIVAAIAGLALSWDVVRVAHVLLLSLFLAELVSLGVRLFCYRRGA